MLACLSAHKGNFCKQSLLVKEVVRLCISNGLQSSVWMAGIMCEAGHGASPIIMGAFMLAGLSRYESDFQELKSLGKGGYGVVVAAINRLDGRY